jgi:hypothetical protein
VSISRRTAATAVSTSGLPFFVGDLLAGLQPLAGDGVVHDVHSDASIEGRSAVRVPVRGRRTTGCCRSARAPLQSQGEGMWVRDAFSG